MYEFNSCQTPLEELNIESLQREFREQYYEFLTSVPFIRNLTAKDRPRAKDLPRDEEGKIIVNLTKPHILEDMDYFRQTGLYFQQHGKYTELRPNNNPNSEYYKWFKEEVRRCWYGMVRPSDGEWIPGDLYFYWNYTEIQLADKSSNKKKSKKAVRRYGIPDVWDGTYFVAHYLYQAREAGEHFCMLSSRGKGKTLFGASLLTKRFKLGEDELTQKGVTCYITAADTKYLNKGNQILTAFQHNIDFLTKNTEFPNKSLLSRSLKDMNWVAGRKDLAIGDVGSGNTVVGITSNEDAEKLRGSRACLYIIEEGGCHIKGTEVLMYDTSIKKVEDIREGDLLMGIDGKERKVLQCFNGTDDLYKITLSNGDWQIVNSKHPIYYFKKDWNKNTYSSHLSTAPELMKFKTLSKGYYLKKANIKYPHKDVKIDPYLLGLWLGDGCHTSLTIANEDNEVLDWLSNNYSGKICDLKQSKTCKVFYLYASNNLKKYFKEYNLLGNKHVPNDYIYNDEEIGLQLLAGLIDTDGNLNTKEHCRLFEITQRYDRKHILDACKQIATNLGFRCSMATRIATGKKPGVLHYRLRIKGDIDRIPTKIKRKQTVPLERKYRSRSNWNDYTFKIEPYDKGEYYGFTIDNDQLFILKDGTIVHNTFSRLLDVWENSIPSVEQGQGEERSVFGILMVYGTSGDDESNFTDMAEIMYHPIGYGVKRVDNVFDLEGKAGNNFSWFFPSYLNNEGCYDKNGNSDVTRALKYILEAREQKKNDTTKINALAKYIAERPIVPQEAIRRVVGNLFPVVELNDRIAQLDNDKHAFDEVAIGSLELKPNGSVEFRMTNDAPIREYPIGTNKVKGAVEIYHMPEVDKLGKVTSGRYIVGHDPVDNDEAETLSLTSTFVLDLFTDNIVAEYTGRQDFADDNFEIVRRLCIFYNATCLYENNKRGLYAYFKKMRCTYMLADTPEYLRDKDLIKTIGIGNSSKGVNATKPINDYANKLIKDWLLLPKPIIEKDVNGQEVESTTYNLFFIKGRALLQELAKYNSTGNFDRVRALGMVMLYREQFMIQYEGNIQPGVSKDRSDDDTYLGNDAFFKNNYDKRLTNYGF